MTDSITNRRNQRLRERGRLHQRRHRREQGVFVAEGEDLVAEALRHGVVPRTVFSVHGAGLPFSLPDGVERVEASAEALSAVSNLGSGSRVVGVFALPDTPELGPATSSAVYLHDVADHVPLAPDGPESLNVAMTATLCLYESAAHRLPSDG